VNLAFSIYTISLRLAMVRLIFSLLAAPTLAARVEIHSGATTLDKLNAEDSIAAYNGLDILAKLKENLNDEDLHEQYREVIGEVEWEEDRAFLMSGMNSDDTPPMLGEASEPGKTQLTVAEMLSGNVGGVFGAITTRIGRFFTGRRDFAIEDAAGGETKYTIDGFTVSLHSRMQVSFPNENAPRFVVRRAFNYLNPVAGAIGQYVYRVIRCQDQQGGFTRGCKEGEMLYTITKDRFGRGALWGQDEWRVYTGTGGCSRYGSGVLSCRKKFQIMYSISEGLKSGSHDTTFYNGHIKAINGDHESGKLYDGTRLNAEDLLGMQVATVSKVSGSPRALNWPMQASRKASNFMFGKGVHHSVETIQAAIDTAEGIADIFTSETADAIMAAEEAIEAGADVTEEVTKLLDFLPVEEIQRLQSQFGSAWSSFSRFATLARWASNMAMAFKLAKALVWADNYRVAFNGGGGSADDLLVSIVAAVQDLTRERVALVGASRIGPGR